MSMRFDFFVNLNVNQALKYYPLLLNTL